MRTLTCPAAAVAAVVFSALWLAAPATLKAQINNPSDIPGLIFWLDGDDVDGDGIAEGAGETTNNATEFLWVDKSSTGGIQRQGGDAFEPTHAVGALNGRSVVAFDGDDHTLSFTDPRPRGYQTTFVVYQDQATKPWTTPIGDNDPRTGGGSFHGNNTEGTIFNGTFTAVETREGDSYRNGVLTSWPDLARPDDYVIDAHVATAPLRSTVAPTPGLDDWLFIGTDDARNLWPQRGIEGGIAEVVMYDNALSTRQLDDVGTYLQDKWGLNWSPITRQWDAVSGDWQTATNWKADLRPDADDPTYVSNGGQASVNNPGQVAGELFLENGQVDVNPGGDLTVATKVDVSGSGTLNLSGSLNTPQINVQGGTVNVQADTSAENVLVTEGSVNAQATLSVQSNLNVAGGTVSTGPSGSFEFNDGSSLQVGDVTIEASEGGSFAVEGSDLSNPTADSPNTLSLQGGTVTIIPPTAAADPSNLAHQWTFDNVNDGFDGLGDSIGTAHGTLENANLSVQDGELQITGVGRMLTDPIDETITEKTLMVWTTLDDLNSPRGGSALTLQNDANGNTFDAIVYAERVPQQWMAGSDFFRRTPANNGGALETSLEEVMLAIVYGADNSITLYRDGQLYGGPYTQGSLQTYLGGTATVQIGRRHGPNNSAYGGSVNEARIYDVALTAEEILAIFDSFGASSDVNLPFWDVELTQSTVLSLETEGSATLGDLIITDLGQTLELADGPQSIQFDTLALADDLLLQEGSFTLMSYAAGVLGDFHSFDFGVVEAAGWSFALNDYLNEGELVLTLTAPSVVIPEPSTVVLLGLGVAGLVLRRRR